MAIAVIGVNFKTAPVEIRERIVFHEEKLPQALKELSNILHVEETVILSTCHRSEIYVAGPNLPRKDHSIIRFLQNIFNLSEEECLPFIYRYHEERAVRHIFNVASGVDSMVLGEAQILGQVKQARQLAETYGTIGRILDRLFRAAIEVGKRCRHETTLGENSGSVSHAAVLLAKRIFSTLEGRTALIIGAGEMGRLTAKSLVKEGLTDIWVTNRTISRAETLAKEFNGKAINFSDFLQHLWKVDIVISSTGAPHYILHSDVVKQAILERRNAPMFLIDLAMPRDLDPKINQIGNVYLYDLDDLEEVVTEENRERETAILQVRQFIETELIKFFSWYHSLGAVPIIKALKEQVEDIRQEETNKFLLKFPDLSLKERTALEALTKGIINKIVHQPLVQLKEFAAEPEGWKYLETAKALFDLTPPLDYKERDASG